MVRLIATSYTAESNSYTCKPQRTTALVRHGSTAILKPVNVSVEKVTTQCVTYDNITKETQIGTIGSIHKVDPFCHLCINPDNHVLHL